MFSAPKIVKVFSDEEDGCTQLVLDKLVNDANQLQNRINNQNQAINKN